MDRGPLTERIIETFDDMPEQLQAGARYVLDRPRDVALLSMREQARQAGVQPATMTRLAKRLGMDGYDEVRELYAAAVRDGDLGFASKAGVQVLSQKLKGDKARAADILTSISHQIQQLATPAGLERIVDAAKALASARRIYCLGLRSSHSIAWHLHYVLTLVGGKGIELFDQNGKSYIDASGGAAVSCLGHGHPDVIAALHRQLDKLAYAHTGFFTTEAAEQLADRLIETAPDGIDHVYLVSGGSEAIEAALKMARQYFVEKGQPQRRHIIARRQSYHGNTLGALATGGNEWRRAQFKPLLIETHHIDPCYAYRWQKAGESEADYAARAAQQLEDKILELGSDQVIAFVAETVVGATSGAVPPVADYFKHIRAICDRHGVLLILDEVMCGMGRTGTLHACEQDGVAPDLMAVAKGLGGGYQPIGAMLARG